MSEWRVNLSLSTLLTITGGGLLLVLLWQLRWLVVVLMVAIVIASTLSPLIRQAERSKIPRWLAVLCVYLGVLGVLVLFGLIVGPTVAQQIERLVRKLPSYLDVLESLAQDVIVRLGLSDPSVLDQIGDFFDIQGLISWGFRTSQELVVRSYGLTRGIVGGFLSLLLALLLSGYMLAGSEKLIDGVVELFPQPWEERLRSLVMPVSQRMGSYIQGRILVSVILGTATSIGLRFLG
ncbi:MAG: AI-2E family transporter, partial [Kamptonema sp. SIO4C4]|nr:AI-2E family transporter [Kamptonema sp. SIO4C4]